MENNFLNLDSLSHWSEWEYKAEGNKNMIFKYNGQNENLRNKLIRVVKEENCSKEHYLSLLKIYSLFPLEYQCNFILHEVSSSFLHNLHIKSLDARPLQRLGRSICLDSELALLMDDYSSFSDLSFEIKPKWAFLPENSKTCRYCLHQQHKFNIKNVEQISSFCPLDLFSGKFHRIKKAFEDLFQNPQNNFKIFKGGKEQKNFDELVRDEYCEVLANIFLNDQILFLLKKYQIASHKDIFHLNSILDTNSILKENIDFHNSIESLRLCIKENSDVDRQLAEFLLSVTLKDLSIFVRDNKRIYYNIKLIDLDPKSPKSLKKYLDLQKSLNKISSAKICAE
jgi:hypothetical protein